jgi:hypothetical protein
VHVAIIHTDNDLVHINTNTTKKLANKGTRFEPSTPYAHHQNGVAETSNRLEVARVRAMNTAAPHLPQSLWPLAATYAVELLNHYPTTAVPDDKTPQQLLLEHTGAANPVSNLCTFRKFGEPGWVHIPKERRVQGEKFAPRATQVYFVGREGSRIYMMWEPIAKKIVRSSSVTFASCEDLLDASIERATALPRPPQGLSPSSPASPPPLPQRSPPRPSVEDAPEDDFELPEQGLGHHFDGLKDSTIINNLTPMRRPKASRHLDISAGFDKRNILNPSVKRSRNPSLAAAIALPNHKLPVRVARAFALAMLSDPIPNELPPEPNGLKQARLHKHSTEWLGAEGAEYLAHKENGTWTIVVVVPVGHRTLPTKWVYKYKLDDAGKLVRFKARLVVCSNRQDNDF